MPSNRRFRIYGFLAALTFLVIIYVTRGAKNTLESPFYTRTVDAIHSRQNALEQQKLREQEADRLAQVKMEHNQAIKDKAKKKAVEEAAADDEEKPRIPNMDKTDDTAAVHRPKPPVGEKPVTGRKTMKNGKVVQTHPEDDDDDGVAKVGNVEPKPTAAAKASEKTPEERKIEAELGSILKKGPIIIFSKSYCPFSKKAKHILLDLYTISPAPYVVELDQHELGPGLQDALLKKTGRRTVPNVLINGRSIGGGDDIEKLHNEGKLVSTVQSMGGKRIVKAEPKEDDSKVGLKFKA